MQQPIIARATAALRKGLARTRPGITLDHNGYVQDPAENLLDDVSLRDFEADLRQGDGKELEGKFRAAHSSSALAVNTFAPFKRRPGSLELAGISGLSVRQFEHKCPTGLQGKPPNLDLVAENDKTVVGVESKCTEFLCRHLADFRPDYEESQEFRSAPWFAEMMRLKGEPTSYAWLDSAQLIKHAFGLARTFHGRTTMLLYLFWEPVNASDFSVFSEHRREITDFSDRVTGGLPEFRAMSYSELWGNWDGGQLPDWLRAHLLGLRARYEISL